MKVDINEFKAKKDGVITPKEVILNLLSAIEKGEIESVVFVAKDKAGYLHPGWSHLQLTEAVGMLECGKVEIIESMYE